MSELSKKQETFIAKVLKGENIFLTGKAGTGKSYVTKKAIQLLKEQGKKIVAIAPTGVAANNIEGQTIHSFFSLPPFGVLDFESCNFVKSEKRKLYNALDVIVIDEVSMLRPDTLDGINWTLLKNGCKPLKEIQVIFVGDLEQLQPVITDNTASVLFQSYEGFEFYHANCYNGLKITQIELDEVKRQSDDEFIHHLNIIRDGGKSPYFKQFLSKDYHGIVLAPHNSTVQKYNEAGLSSINKPVHIFQAIIQGNLNAEDFNMDAEIRVKDGCKIMYLSNSKDNKLVNGTLGTFVYRPNNKGENCYFINVNDVLYPLEQITNTKKEYVLVSNTEIINGKKVITDKLELQEKGSITQLPIKLAYALSIHKSQGLSFDEVTIDLSLECFGKGMLYTALSRVRTPNGLKIIVNR